MRPRHVLVALVALCLTLPTAALAQEPPQVLHELTVDGEALTPGTELTPGQTIFLQGNVTPPDQENTTWRVFVNATLDGQAPGGNGTGPLLSNGETVVFAEQIQAPHSTGAHEIAYTITVQSRNETPAQAPPPDGNGTGNETGNETDGNATTSGGLGPWQTAELVEETISFQVANLAAPPSPGLPWALILLVGAVVVAGGAGAYWWVNRDTQIRSHKPRSQAMADLEGSKYKGQPAAQADPEVHPQLKILEARAADIRRMIELAKDRHERGDLTEHQFNTIRERKEAELEGIEREMSEYREG